MKEKLLNKIKNKLIVSCQALEDEPLHSSFIMSKMAIAAKDGGAVAIRANSVEDILAIKAVVDLPIIGIIKRDYPNSERFITPTMKEIKELVDINVEIVAMDATLRSQIDGIELADKVKYLHDNNVLAMADVSTLEEGLAAEKAGFDLISSTLSGYTSYSKKSNGPDFKLVKDLVNNTNTPIIAEGKIFGEEDLHKILDAKPFAVVIGSAITRPQVITEKYNNIINKYNS